MLPDIELLLELQSVDQEVARLKAEIAYLPKHIAEIESKLTLHVRQVESDEATLAAHYKERKNCESEIKVLREKISKYKEQMLAVKTNDQYRALQHEIDFAENSIRGWEDQILEKMVLDDDLETAVKTAKAALAAEKVEVEKEKKHAATRSKEDEAELARSNEQRAQIRARVSDPAYRAYEALVRQKKTPAVVAVKDGACRGCRVMLRPQALNELRANDRLRYCESCHRIFYFAAAVAE